MSTYDPSVDPLPPGAPPGKHDPHDPLPPAPRRARRAAARALAAAVIALPSLAVLALALSPRGSAATARDQVGAAPAPAPWKGPWTYAKATPDPAPRPAPAPAPVAEPSPGSDLGFVRVVAEAERGLVHDPAEPVHVVVTVTGGPAPEGATRAPARVALVVDRSGSMASGDKIGFAHEAVRAFLRGLGPADACALLGFDHEVTTAFDWAPGGTVAPDDPRISALGARGGTDIAKALDAAERAVLAARRAGEACRIVLLTDGQDGSGRDLVAIARRLREQGITLSCHGFGADVDGRRLGALAETGGGNYLFVDSGPRAVSAFETERDLALATVAQGVSVRLEPSAGVEVEEVVSWQATTDGAARVVQVGDVAAGTEKKVVVRLRWARAAARDGRVPLLGVTAAAAPPGGARVTSAALDVAAGLADTAEAARASARPHLAAKLAQATFASAMRDVQAQLERGDAAGARAAARTAYERLAACPAALDEARARSFGTSQGAVTFFTTGELSDDADDVIQADLLPVGR